MKIPHNFFAVVRLSYYTYEDFAYLTGDVALKLTAKKAEIKVLKGLKYLCENLLKLIIYTTA